jgi:hypothetical protein
MAIGSRAAEVLGPSGMAHTLSEVGDDASSERVAANAGEVFTEEVGGATDVASGSGADHFDVVAFPVHLVATDGSRGCLRDGVEVGGGQPKGRIGVDGVT